MVKMCYTIIVSKLNWFSKLRKSNSSKFQTIKIQSTQRMIAKQTNSSALFVPFQLIW